MENLKWKIYKRIGAKIIYYRTLRGLTQGQLAELVHLSESTISKIERNSYNKSISLDTLLDITNGLGIEFTALFSADHGEKMFWKEMRKQNKIP